MAHADEIEVTDAWFEPHFAPRESQPLEMCMYRAWKKLMSYEDHRDVGWCSEIASLLCHIPHALNERGGRVAATFVLWLMTNNGSAFLGTLFKDQEGYTSSWNSEERAIKSWAFENRLSAMTRNTLVHLLHGSEGRPAYPDQPHPTLEDYRVIEKVCIFLVSDQGKAFLRTVYKNAARLNGAGKIRTLPF